MEYGPKHIRARVPHRSRLRQRAGPRATQCANNATQCANNTRELMYSASRRAAAVQFLDCCRRRRLSAPQRRAAEPPQPHRLAPHYRSPYLSSRHRQWPPQPCSPRGPSACAEPNVVCHLERFCHLKPFCHLCHLAVWPLHVPPPTPHASAGVEGPRGQKENEHREGVENGVLAG